MWKEAKNIQVKRNIKLEFINKHVATVIEHTGISRKIDQFLRGTHHGNTDATNHVHSSYLENSKKH